MQCKLFADLHNSATPAQRQKLTASLKAYAADAQAMALLPVALSNAAKP
jgi:hypothetical protein